MLFAACVSVWSFLHLSADARDEERQLDELLRKAVVDDQTSISKIFSSPATDRIGNADSTFLDSFLKECSKHPNDKGKILKFLTENKFPREHTETTSTECFIVAVALENKGWIDEAYKYFVQEFQSMYWVSWRNNFNRMTVAFEDQHRFFVRNHRYSQALQCYETLVDTPVETNRRSLETSEDARDIPRLLQQIQEEKIKMVNCLVTVLEKDPKWTLQGKKYSDLLERARKMTSHIQSNAKS